MPPLPLEIILDILTLSMRSDQPLHLDLFVLCVSKRKISTQSKHRSMVPTASPPLPESHQRDWIIATSVCRAWRQIGKKAFFAEKVVLISPEFMKRFSEDDGTTIDLTFQALALGSLRHVIVLVPSRTVEKQMSMVVPYWQNLKYFNALTGLEDLFLLLDVISEEEYLQNHDWQNAHNVKVPRFFLETLAEIGLDTDRLRPKLLVSKSRPHYEGMRDEGIVDWEFATMMIIGGKLTPAGVHAWLRSKDALIRDDQEALDKQFPGVFSPERRRAQDKLELFVTMAIGLGYRRIPQRPRFPR
ncbi:uncharacterized protein KY384_003455 [Bacidia gigantensis]|uniref:uncharacterized protein n=1 Tax=Bacidia gigantensis TaxID=2732470 RepID=UPI001D03A9FD|nr:uncharacterized protein KY384_003455 [Bacidia gigantensis]KAG8531819.1 hypothetical protein KY384_003455 [Bacidia gigantensis]